ncbi:MAG: radical SAM protein [Clostridia bacterium]|nr:radical SAM protein [Clostridia bacterium]
MEFTCSLCPRRCGALRTDTVGHGFCRMPAAPVIARAALHFGEEPCISGQNGSGTVFFAGCTLRCGFCQNREISRGPVGKAVTTARLAEIFRELVEQGAANINLVNPTHYAAAIREALMLYRPPVPVVYNSGGYETVDTLRSLEGLIDVYLPDLKYLSPSLSGALSGATDYATFACDAVLEMARQTGPAVFDERGMLTRGTVVRHLVLPGHTAESLAVIDWLSRHLPEGALTSLMFQYTPMADIDGFPELSRRLTARECEKVWRHLADTDLDGYVQDRESAGTQMIPIFDTTGV